MEGAGWVAVSLRLWMLRGCGCHQTCKSVLCKGFQMRARPHCEKCSWAQSLGGWADTFLLVFFPGLEVPAMRCAAEENWELSQSTCEHLFRTHPSHLPLLTKIKELRTGKHGQFGEGRSQAPEPTHQGVPLTLTDS